MQSSHSHTQTIKHTHSLLNKTSERVQRPIWLNLIKWLKNIGKNEEGNDPSKNDDKEKQGGSDNQETNKNNGHDDRSSEEGSGDISNPGVEDVCPNKYKQVQGALMPKEASQRLFQ